MFKFRRLTSLILLVVFLTCVQPRQSEAFAPLVVVPIAAAVITGAALYSYIGMSMYQPSSVPSGWGSGAVYTTAGNIARIVYGTAQQTNQYNQQVLVGKEVSMIGSASNLASWIASLGSTGQSKYPILSGMLMTNPQPGAAPGMVVGGNYTFAGSPGTGIGKVTSISVYGASGYSGRTSWLYAPGDWVILTNPYMNGSTQMYATTTHYMFNGNQPAGIGRAKTASEIAASPPPATWDAPTTSELDKAIADAAAGSTGTFNVVDGTNPGGLDSLPPAIYVPPTAAPPVDSTQPSVTGLNQGTVTAANNNLAAANSTLAAAQTALANAQTALAANPSDPTLQAAVASAQAAVNSAQGQVTAAQSAVNSATQANNDVYPNASVDTLKSIDWTPFRSLKGCMANVWPFTLLSNIGNYYSVLTATPTAPVFIVPLPLGFSMTVDLAPFDPIATLCRYLIAMLLVVGCILYVVRFWRGVE